MRSPSPSFHQEIDKFSRMAQQAWDENGPFCLLHRMTPLRMRYIREQVTDFREKSTDERYPFKDLSFLDVGCGAGLICEPLSRLGAYVTGIDASPKMIEVAQEHARLQNLTIAYRNQFLQHHLEQEKRYDVVVSFEVLEHLEDPELFLKQCYTILKPNGLLLLSTLNRTFLSYSLGILFAEYVMGWAPVGTHDWKRFLTPEELKWYLGRAQFCLPTFQGMTYNPFSRSWNFVQKNQMNYFICAKKTI